MKFEKINDDKIKITLCSADLEANDLFFFFEKTLFFLI